MVGVRCYVHCMLKATEWWLRRGENKRSVVGIGRYQGVNC